METISKEIEDYKKLLNLIVVLFGFNSDITLKVSQRLDVLINEFYGI